MVFHKWQKCSFKWEEAKVHYLWRAQGKAPEVDCGRGWGVGLGKPKCWTRNRARVILQTKIAGFGLWYTSSPTRRKKFKKLVQYYVERKLEFFAGCDASLHPTVWSSSDVNPRGENLCKYLTAPEFPVLNRRKISTSVTRMRQEILDIIICSLRLQKSVWS